MSSLLVHSFHKYHLPTDKADRQRRKLQLGFIMLSFFDLRNPVMQQKSVEQSFFCARGGKLFSRYDFLRKF
jgi:hypothetical protein